MVPVVDLKRRGARFADGVRRTRARRSSPAATLLLGSETERLEAELVGVDRRSSCGRRRVGRVGAAARARGARRRSRRRGDRAGVHRGARPRRQSSRPAPHPCSRDVRREHRGASTRTRSPQRAPPGRRRSSSCTSTGVPPRSRRPTSRSSRTLRRPTVRSTTTRRSAATIYSFYPTKNLGGVGDGGAVVTHDAAVAEQVRLLRAHGMTTQYVHEAISQNFRMSEIEAAWLRLTLPSLAADNDASPGDRPAPPRSRRRTCAGRTQHPSHVYHLCVLRADDRDAARARLDDARRRDGDPLPTRPHAAAGLPPPRHARLCPRPSAWAALVRHDPVLPRDDRREVETVAQALQALGCRRS